MIDNHINPNQTQLYVPGSFPPVPHNFTNYGDKKKKRKKKGEKGDTSNSVIV